MSITPGEEPRGRTDEPMLAEEPLPPGNGDIEAKVEELDKKLRASGSDEAAEAQDSKEQPDETSEGEEEDVS
ncbi:hypothetical protein BJF86_02950 [Serinicoccus sp. CNJ-927]|uniref:hypothetical protein n=1 Tax=unclassified Serinicoccus TaxID=2643101 RepID=UPI0009659D35|nr:MULTISPECIES: hypothetical protein [unclassified Serinicoccus]OLT18931.1 hypothetical protein BJF80_13885 [Serinicoccus sp. CUA-874]OLT41966.1 hypothetical protein BJF86_02950 [Serinicoccus sp. CNJ-927]